MGILIYLNAVLFLAGFINGLTSFGANLFSVPLMTFVIDPRSSIMVGCIACGAMNIYMAIIYWRHVVWKDCLCLILSELAGMPAGVYFLSVADPSYLLLAAAGGIILFLLWQIISKFLSRQSPPIRFFWVFPLGFIAGVFSGAISMGGPPIVLYAYLRQWEEKEILGTLNMVPAVVTGFGVIPTIAAMGMFTSQVIEYSLWGSLAGGLGVLASVPLIARINIHLFRNILLAMLGFSALMLLYRGLGA